MNLAIEMMSSEQLDRVAGGTMEELQNLSRAIAGNVALQGLASIGSALPFGSRLSKTIVTDILDKVGIEANIDVNTLGFLGFGIGEKNNTYKDKVSGRSLTHRQVLNILIAFNKK